MDPNIWGPHAWFLIHTVCLNYPDNPTDEDKKRFAELKQKQKEEEEYRIYRLRQRDEDIEAHFKSTHHNRLQM